MKGGILLWLAAMLAAAGPVLAGHPVELELPTLDGARFFNLTEMRDRPVLINLWDTACPFCLREMPLLNAFAQAHPEMRVAGIALAPTRQSLDYLETHPADYLQLAAPADPSALLRRLGDPHGALPHSVLLGPDHAVCAVRTGPLDRHWLEAALARCK